MKGFRSVVLVILLVCASQAALFARGQAEVDLSYADKLITERKYNEALSYLKDYMIQYPEYWDKAQERVNRIIKLREAYNANTEALIKLLQEDPANEAKKITLIKRLQDIEANPNQSQEEFLQKIEATAIFKVNQQAYDDIFAQGRALIDKREYVKAARIYETGYKLYKEEFDSGNFGAQAVESVNSGLGEIRASLQEFEGAQAEFVQAAANVKQAIPSGAAKLEESLNQNEASLRKLISLRNKVGGQGRVFEDQFAILQKANPGLTDSSFLPFAFRFTLGRKNVDSGVREGMLGAMDAQLAAILDDWENAAGAVAKADYDAVVKSYDSGAYALVASQNAELAQFGAQAQRMLALWTQVTSREAPQTLQSLGQAIVSAKAPRALATQYLCSASSLYAKAAGVMQEALALFASGKEAAAPFLDAADLNSSQASKAVTSILSTCAASQAQRASLAANILQAANLRAEFERYGDGKRPGGAIAVEGWAANQAGLEKRIRQADGELRANEIVLISQAATIESRAVSQGLDAEDANILRARTLISGTPATIAGLENFRVCDPVESIAVIGKTEASLKAKLLSIGGLFSKYGGMDAYVTDSDAYKKWKADTLTLETRVTNMLASTTEVIRLARSQKQQADSAKLEADRLFNEAKLNLTSENFDFALDRLNTARARYLTSLSFQWNKKLKDDSDQATLDLEGQIFTARRNRVVRDFRKLVTQGTDSYYQSDFEKSQDYLVRAQALWRTAYEENNQEADFWLSLVKNAVSFRTGRVLQPTAPLFSEMSQLLSQAKLSYEEGKALIKRGRKVDAIKVFNVAKTKVQQVKTVFPNNQEASVLQIKINLEIDHDIADKLFKQYFDEAKSKLATTITANKREGYNDLTILKAINPGYPGLAKAIENAEIELKIKPPPPKPADIANAMELTSNAKRIIEARNKILYQKAAEWLDQAIMLYPANAEAKSLKDRLLLEGGVAVQTGEGLSAADAKRYQDAEMAYSKGQFLDARSIVDSLLQNPRNKKDAQLVSLKDKIEKALNNR